MAIDLGQALLQKDYNQELRDATEHYRKMGKAQGLWGQIGGYGGQALATALLSATLPGAGMAIAGGLANALGTYAGGALAGAQYGDYDAKFGQETIGELGSALDDSLLTSAITSGIQGGASSYKAGLGAGEEAVGKVTEEALETGLQKAAENQIQESTLFEFGNLADTSAIGMGNLKAKDVRTQFEAIAPDGTIQTFNDYDEIFHDIGKKDLTGTPWEGYEFQTRIDDTVYDFEFGKGLWDAHLEDTMSGSPGSVQSFLRKTDLETMGLDPMQQVGIDPASGNPITLQDSLSGFNQEDLISYYQDSYKDMNRLNFQQQAALRGLDDAGNFLVDDPADLGPETFGKRWQDIQAMGGLFGGGWGKSGGLEGLLGGANFGFHFEPQPDVVGFDPVTQQFTSTPAPNQSMNPWQWAKNNKLMAALGGTGLLWTLLSQD
jgi:hypothetical protein